MLYKPLDVATSRRYMQVIDDILIGNIIAESDMQSVFDIIDTSGEWQFNIFIFVRNHNARYVILCRAG